ncbi:MAG: carboxylesterase [Gammaproteobacteria bacterium]|nr:carboxylesterase [Gammaproteobacteria bacterium]
MDSKNYSLECIEKQTGPNPKHAIIWLHGLGADGNDFVPIVPELNLDHNYPVRFIFPHAPHRSITVNGGMVMRGWYDIVGLPILGESGFEEDRSGMVESQHIVNELISKQNNQGIPTSNIILAGFSQGGAVALYTGLRMNERLAGIIALSTYLPFGSMLEKEQNPANSNTSIFYAHGVMDPVINISAAMLSRNILQGLSYEVEWKTYPIPHSVHPEEILSIGQFINKSFS